MFYDSIIIFIIYKLGCRKKGNKFKVNKLSGLDEVLLKFFKLVGKVIVLVFIDIFNYSFKCRIVFFFWKIVCLILIFKKDD